MIIMKCPFVDSWWCRIRDRHMITSFLFFLFWLYWSFNTPMLDRMNSSSACITSLHFLFAWLSLMVLGKGWDCPPIFGIGHILVHVTIAWMCISAHMGLTHATILDFLWCISISDVPVRSLHGGLIMSQVKELTCVRCKFSGYAFPSSLSNK